MIDKDCSPSLIFGIVNKIGDQSEIDKLEDPSSLKMTRENSDRCRCEKNPSFV